VTISRECVLFVVDEREHGGGDLRDIIGEVIVMAPWGCWNRNPNL
jgi:hypothetical protein